MGAIATFNYDAWVARYSEFITIPEPLVGLYFGEAGLYLNNAGCGPVQDTPTQTVLLYMITAHIAKLNSPKTASASDGSADLVGRVSSASEGSVSVSVEMDLPPGSAQWFAQTKYGAAYWQASARFRTMRYIPPIQQSTFPIFGGGLFGRRW